MLKAPIDGATLPLLTDDDMKMLGLDLPAQRRRLACEIKLFQKRGAPRVSFFLKPRRKGLEVCGFILEFWIGFTLSPNRATVLPSVL